MVSFNSCWRPVYIYRLYTFSFTQQTFIIENLLGTEFAHHSVVFLNTEAPALMKVMEIEYKYLLSEWVNEWRLKQIDPLSQL